MIILMMKLKIVVVLDDKLVKVIVELFVFVYWDFVVYVEVIVCEMG